MRKTYSKTFKLEVRQLILDQQKTVNQIASEYAISRPIVSRWIVEYKRYGSNAFAG